jgi:hypothetical protein
MKDFSLSCWRPRCWSVTLLACASVLIAAAAPRLFPPQSALTVSQVKKVYVDSLGDKQGANQLRDALIARLHQSKEIQVVAASGEADAVITGNGEIWIKGYYTTDPKPSKYNQVPIYGGMLSVELKGKNDETLWSYLVTPSKVRWASITKDLSDQLVKKLLETLRKSVSTGAAH